MLYIETLKVMMILIYIGLNFAIFNAALGCIFSKLIGIRMKTLLKVVLLSSGLCLAGLAQASEVLKVR